MRHFKANPWFQRLAFSSYTMAVTRELNWISRTQIKLVRQIIQIAFVLKLTGIVLLLLPFLQQFFGKRTAVGFALRLEWLPG